MAAAYARLWSPVIKPMALPILDMVPLAQARDVLDVGTGTGDFYEDLRARAPGARVIPGLAVMDAQRLAIAESAFDVALCIFVLFHLPDPLQGLREVRRVLRPGKQIGTVTWGEDPGPPGGAIWREALDAAGAAPDPRDPSLMQHSRMDTGTKVEALLREAGFTTVQTEARRVAHRFTAEDLLTVQLRCGVASRRLRSLGAD